MGNIVKVYYTLLKEDSMQNNVGLLELKEKNLTVV